MTFKMTQLDVYREVTLRRDFFVTRCDLDEFDWVLGELGVPEHDRVRVEQVDIRVDRVVYDPED